MFWVEEIAVRSHRWVCLCFKPLPGCGRGLRAAEQGKVPLESVSLSLRFGKRILRCPTRDSIPHEKAHSFPDRVFVQPC